MKFRPLHDRVVVRLGTRPLALHMSRQNLTVRAYFENVQELDQAVKDCNELFSEMLRL